MRFPVFARAIAVTFLASFVLSASARPASAQLRPPTQPGDSAKPQKIATPSTKSRASKDLVEACNNKDYPSCAMVGAGYVTGRIGGKQNVALGRVYLSKACEGRLAHGCVTLGLSYSNISASGRSLTKARLYFGMACTGGAGTGCVMLGMMREAGDGGPVELPKARQAFKLACGFKYPAGCRMLAHLLLSGQGGPRDAAEARRLLVMSCKEGDPQGCGDLAQVEVDGRGGAKAPKRGRKRAHEACESGVTTACYLFGKLSTAAIGGSPDFENGIEALANACGAGLAAACTLAAKTIQTHALVGYDSLRLFRAGCAWSDANACLCAALHGATASTAFSPPSRWLAVRGVLLLFGLELERNLREPVTRL